MAGECLVISVILGAMIVGFFRANRKNWGLAVVPLGFVPLVTGAVMYFVERVFHANWSFLLPMILIVASLGIACIWIGVCSVILIKTKKLRISYVGVSVVFVFTVSLILLIKYYFAALPIA